MATQLTFGNPLKFGPDSCHNAKGRPTFLHREREHPKPRTKHTIISIRALQWGPVRVGAVATTSGRTRAHNDGGGVFAPSQSRLGIDRLATPLGIDESLAFRAFDKTIIFGHWLSKTQKLALAFEAFLLKKAYTIS